MSRKESNILIKAEAFRQNSWLENHRCEGSLVSGGWIHFENLWRFEGGNFTDLKITEALSNKSKYRTQFDEIFPKCSMCAPKKRSILCSEISKSSKISEEAKKSGPQTETIHLVGTLLPHLGKTSKSIQVWNDKCLETNVHEEFIGKAFEKEEHYRYFGPFVPNRPENYIFIVLNN